MNKEPIFILLGIIILIGLAWDPIKNGSPTSQSSTNSGSSSFQNSNISPEKKPETSKTVEPVSEKQVSEQIARTERAAKELQKKLEEEALKQKRSPYYGKIRLSHISYINNPDPSREYMTLYTNINAGEKINITGWKLQSERTGNWVKIGQASTLPFPFSLNYQDVILQQGNIAYLIKGFSPIGISFRTNKCTGYFAEKRTFYPYLARYCPVSKEKDMPQFSSNLDRDDECKDFIKRIPACTTATNYINFRDLPDTITTSCKTYMETKFTYNACVQDHFGDTDFPGREWYVYMNVFGPLWRDKREHIILYDTQDLIVSEISY